VVLKKTIQSRGKPKSKSQSGTLNMTKLKLLVRVYKKLRV
jgi:hypothetical protein